MMAADFGRKVVVVHRGPRDAYQAARALNDAGLLDRLVTDLYWPADTKFGAVAKQWFPRRLLNALFRRNAPTLPSGKVDTGFGGGLWAQLLEKMPAPFAWKRRTTRWTDAALGKRAADLAVQNHSALLSYSYYAHTAFRRKIPGTERILFQLHPHPASVRRILLAELAAHPECAVSLKKEWELSVPEKDFARLCGEAGDAQHCICASSFTRSTLVENGIAPGRVHVIPYGVDLKRFSPGPERPRTQSGRLRLLFVGTINQRKGIKYLLQALRLLRTGQVELQVCGRVVDDLSIFDGLSDSVRITPSVSPDDLLEAYRAADLFVLPSVAEGFGQVLLESLACGLPILSTSSTAAPDLIAESEQGFVVAPGDTVALAERIEWALDHRKQLTYMRAPARARAEQFTWRRFRTSLAARVQLCMESSHSELRRTTHG